MPSHLLTAPLRRRAAPRPRCPSFHPPHRKLFSEKTVDFRFPGQLIDCSRDCVRFPHGRVENRCVRKRNPAWRAGGLETREDLSEIISQGASFVFGFECARGGCRACVRSRSRSADPGARNLRRILTRSVRSPACQPLRPLLRDASLLAGCSEKFFPLPLSLAFLAREREGTSVRPDSASDCPGRRYFREG